MRKIIAKFISECVICQQVKHTTNKPIRLLQPLVVPIEIWKEVSMDFITGLPNIRGDSVIVTVVDRLSKFCHLGSQPSTYNTVAVERFFIHNVAKTYNFPKSIVSDRDKVFLSKF